MIYRNWIVVVLFIVSAFSFSVLAETKEEKRARKELEKIQKLREDSVDYKMAIKAIEKSKFALMADKISVRANTKFVQDNMNFIATSPERSMLQLVPIISVFNGINLKGSLSKINVKTLKNGDTEVILDIFGSTLNARVMITMWKGSNEARAIVMPNFNRGDITLYGKIFPLDVFNELEDALRY